MVSCVILPRLCGGRSLPLSFSAGPSSRPVFTWQMGRKLVSCLPCVSNDSTVHRLCFPPTGVDPKPSSWGWLHEAMEMVPMGWAPCFTAMFYPWPCAPRQISVSHSMTTVNCSVQGLLSPTCPLPVLFPSPPPILKPLNEDRFMTVPLLLFYVCNRSVS